ncbi:MAG: L,D-transpeptidase family protein [Spongiibacteraceae bacterium]|jgi:L,D-transpeptidase ErfK/SrfK|nr:L,D-transpeptidase family protein [Spongiibacteraceae bacterium]
MSAISCLLAPLSLQWPGRSQLLVPVLLALLQGCSHLSQPAPPLEPVASHRFEFDPATESVVGEIQIVQARADDTLSDIARRFNLGYEEIVRANPGVDPWLPRAGTEIVLPTRHVLPDAPRRGIVINLAAMRLYHFLEPAADGTQTVVTHPVGIGRVGWHTPQGTTTVISKRTDPTWYPPVSVRREHAANGDPLPAAVPPGPDNPLGRHAMRLGWTSYLIHGTNRPYGVGLRASHGCIRMYPEDIEQLYEQTAIGTPVTIVNQPVVLGWRGDTLYAQAFPALEEDQRDWQREAPRLLTRALRERNMAPADAEVIGVLVAQPRGIAVPLATVQDLDGYLAGAPRVLNQLPLGANWSGID